jgi:hypothetical protein
MGWPPRPAPEVSEGEELPRKERQPQGGGDAGSLIM